MKTIFLAAAAVLIFAQGALAYRPLNTEDSGVASKGVIQGELSYDYLKWKNGATDQTILFVAPIYGLAENLELSIEIPYIFHTAAGVRSEGLGDINLVGKYVLLWDDYESKSALLTLKGATKLNSGDQKKGLGQGDVEYSLSTVLSKAVNDTITLHSQLGYAIATDKQNPDLRNHYFYGLAADLAVTKPLHVLAELTDSQNPDRTQSHQSLALIGFTYEVSKRFTLDVSFKKGLNAASPDWGAGVGGTLEF